MPLVGGAQIPFLELVEAEEVKKVRYKLSGGTPFAKTDINEVRCAQEESVSV